jgi:hypothetical protein
LRNTVSCSSAHISRGVTLITKNTPRVSTAQICSEPSFQQVGTHRCRSDCKRCCIFFRPDWWTLLTRRWRVWRSYKVPSLNPFDGAFEVSAMLESERTTDKRAYSPGRGACAEILNRREKMNIDNRSQLQSRYPSSPSVVDDSTSLRRLTLHKGRSVLGALYTGENAPHFSPVPLRNSQCHPIRQHTRKAAVTLTLITERKTLMSRSSIGTPFPEIPAFYPTNQVY